MITRHAKIALSLMIMGGVLILSPFWLIGGIINFSGIVLLLIEYAKEKNSQQDDSEV